MADIFPTICWYHRFSSRFQIKSESTILYKSFFFFLMEFPKHSWCANQWKKKISNGCYHQYTYLVHLHHNLSVQEHAASLWLLYAYLIGSVRRTVWVSTGLQSRTNSKLLGLPHSLTDISYWRNASSKCKSLITVTVLSCFFIHKRRPIPATDLESIAIFSASRSSYNYPFHLKARLLENASLQQPLYAWFTRRAPFMQTH